jgi:aminopeptidase N
MLRLFRVAALALVASFAAGSARAIDPFFPTFGNAGIDVVHYGLDLDVNPISGHLDARAELLIFAERRLDSFTLDLGGLTVSKVRIRGERVDFGQADDKLTITPRWPIPRGAAFRLVVDYSGKPTPIQDPTDSDYQLGWFKYNNATYVVSEPVGASTFFPANDEPTDKATFTIAITVPSPYAGIANGIVTSARTIGNERRFVWEMRQPMTTWLATVHVNKFNVKFAHTPSGKPVSVFYTSTTPKADVDGYLLAAKMIPYIEHLIGPYPFDGYGSVVVDDPILYYALETQAMTTFPTGAADEAFVSHELTHMWFGDSVSVKKWADLWIAEGAATYFEILWPNRDDPAAFDAAMQENYDYVVANHLGPAVVDDPADLFSDRVYLRGAAALYALRQKVGDPTFFMILRRFVFEYRGRNASSADFIRTAVAVSHNIYVAKLLHDWLYEEDVPSLPGHMALAKGAKVARPDVVGLRCGPFRHHGRPEKCN